MLIKGVYICCYLCMWEPLSGGLSDLLVFLKQLNMARKGHYYASEKKHCWCAHFGWKWYSLIQIALCWTALYLSMHLSFITVLLHHMLGFSCRVLKNCPTL